MCVYLPILWGQSSWKELIKKKQGNNASFDKSDQL